MPGNGAPQPISNAEVIFGGTQGDTTKQIPAALANGKFVVVLPGSPSAAPAAGQKAKGKQAAKGGDKEPPVLPSVAEVEKMNPVDAAKVEGILKEVKVPAGFDVKVFATPPAVNYPVFVAAAPDGTVYISSDGNVTLTDFTNISLGADITTTADTIDIENALRKVGLANGPHFDWK